MVPRLLVHPSRAQGKGVGPQLLEAVWGDAARRRTVTDAIQPVSNVLYARRGLAPVTPLLTFTGTPQIAATAAEAPAELDSDRPIAYGFDRTVDHRTGNCMRDVPSGAMRTRTCSPAVTSGRSPGRRPGRRRVHSRPSSRRPRGRCASGFPALRASSSPSRCAHAFASERFPGLVLLSPGVEPPTALAPSGYMLF